jgi:hypothetical protein
MCMKALMGADVPGPDNPDEVARQLLADPNEEHNLPRLVELAV